MKKLFFLPLMLIVAACGSPSAPAGGEQVEKVDTAKALAANPYFLDKEAVLEIYNMLYDKTPESFCLYDVDGDSIPELFLHAADLDKVVVLGRGTGKPEKIAATTMYLSARGNYLVAKAEDGEFYYEIRRSRIARNSFSSYYEDPTDTTAVPTFFPISGDTIEFSYKKAVSILDTLPDYRPIDLEYKPWNEY